jgi:phytoene/squalene synthetase
MTDIYHELLRKIASHDYNVLNGKVRLSMPAKVGIAATAWFRTSVLGR